MSISAISHQEEGQIDGLHFSVSEKQSSPSISQEKPPIFEATWTMNQSPPQRIFDEEALNYLLRVEYLSTKPPYDDEIHAAFRSLIVFQTDWVETVVIEGLLPDGGSYHYNKVTSLLRFFGDIIKANRGEDDNFVVLQNKLNDLFPNLLDEMYTKLDGETLEMFVD